MKTNSHVFKFNRQAALCFRIGVFLVLASLAFSAVLGQAQAANYVLGTTALLEGPAEGNDSVVLAVTPQTATWTATTNAAWLHLSVANQSGTGSKNVVFNFDSNLGATRTGTLTIGGQTLTVTQAGSTYVPAGSVTTLASFGGPMAGRPIGVAVDSAGDVYITPLPYRAILRWAATNNAVTVLVDIATSQPDGVAVDGDGNAYFTASENQGIYQWTATNNTVTGLFYENLPFGPAVDGAGNVYIASSAGGGAINEWMVVNSNVTTLVSAGLNNARFVAVDGAGNVYISDTGNKAIKKWTAMNSNVTTLVSSGLNTPTGVAVDGAGNVYIADYINNAIMKWTAASSNVTTLVSSGLNGPNGVAADVAGNVYIADSNNNAVKELPYVFVDPTAKSESLAAGTDALPAVLPATENLRSPFAPSSDQPWLTISGVTNGVVSFSFTANTGSTRTAHITLLGQTIPVAQAGIMPPTLTGATMLGNGAFQFAFSNNQGMSFTVISSTNLSLPLTNWTAVGTPSNIGPGLFQLTTQSTTNDPQRFYRVRSP
jgi:sugar lactone lactonase YvrE